jgi:hypothetical protein
MTEYKTLPNACRIIPDQPFIVSGLGDNVSVNALIQNLGGTSPDMAILVNNEEKGSSILVTNGDQIQIKVCSSPNYDSRETFVLSYGGNFPSVSLTTPYLSPVTFDGQTYIVCPGDSVDVTFNIYHNIRETATNAACEDYIGNEISEFKNPGSRVIFDHDELSASPGQTRYFNCEIHCGSKFATTCPLVVPIDGIDTLIDETYPERIKYTQFAVYAETELATMPRLLELQINLADGSHVNGTDINRIDSTNILTVLVPDTSGYKLFDGSFTASGFNAYRDTPGELYQNKFNTAFAATGGRLLCEGVAIPLALYGSNDGTNWTRVAALDVVSVTRNYGCGENTVQSCAHLPFGAAPQGAHVFRFAATDILYQSDTPLYVRDVQATLADGTEYLFPASEFSFIAPRVAKPASPVAAAGLPAIVQNVFFESGHWSQTFGGYKYNATQGDIYIYSVGGVPGSSKSDIRDIYFIQYNTTTRLWGDHGSNYPHFVTQTGRTVVLSADDISNVATFIDPYYAIVQDVYFTSGHWGGGYRSWTIA